jgi:hypothetical protein
MIDPNLKPEYSGSHALIIGIDEFQYASPLEYAVSDANSVAETLITNFGFPTDHVRLLVNTAAGRRDIMSAYLSYGQAATAPNDRLLVFFAGHGFTCAGSRGEIGFLVPHDGNPADLSTLIRWDELTYNAELIKAKHLLFVMDACYGGLILQRGISAGSMRFLKDMLLRPVRQVITAGKADQVVADSGGPRPSHSVFTGYFLNALDGKAATNDGVITANSVMAYVYDKVSKDIHSHQTPHFGFFDGDGDFIFQAPSLLNLTREDKVDEDVLITVPSVEVPEELDHEQTLVEKVKEYIADSKALIKLHDLSVRQVRNFLVETNQEKFPVQGVPFGVPAFVERLDHYRFAVRDLQQLTSCLTYWGEDEHRTILRKILSRATDNLQSESGSVVWLALRWYPIMLLTYASGIAAVSAKKYGNLHVLLTAPSASRHSSSEPTELLWSLGEAISELHDAFKTLPGHEKNYVPRSEYLFKLLQPDVDDLFFIGREYENVFDQFEVILALTHADLYNQKHGHVWGPIGRFGWKYSGRGHRENPLKDIVGEAQRMDSDWPPLKAGFFGGDKDRFIAVANAFEEGMKKLNWW